LCIFQDRGYVSGPADIGFEADFPLYLYKDSGFVFFCVNHFDELFIQASILNDAGMLKFKGQCRAMPKPQL
jgi:hypothetical protein